MSSTVTPSPPPSPPQLPVTHGWWQPPSCLCLHHLNHTRTWYCHHTLSSISNQYIAMCVYVFVCPDWVCDPLLRKRMWVWANAWLCVFDKQAFLRKVCLTVGLSDKLPFWRKAYGLGRANKYTPRKSQLLTPGQRKLRSKGCIEYKSKSVMWYSSSYKHSQLSAWCKIQETSTEWLVLIQGFVFVRLFFMSCLFRVSFLPFKHQTAVSTYLLLVSANK